MQRNTTSNAKLTSNVSDRTLRFMVLHFLLLLIITLVAGRRDSRLITSLNYSRYYVKPVVVNGFPASLGQVPYMVALKEHEKNPKKRATLWGTLCGGSIIASSKVLTAAHCFDYKDYSKENNRAKLRAVAGDLQTVERHDLTPDSTSTTQWRRVSNIVRHHDYHFPYHDIALIFIPDPWVFNGYVEYITLARSTADYLTWCTASGYGNLAHTRESHASTRLLTVKLYVLPRHECSKLWEMNMDDFLCTRATYSDVAEGDSGGPLVCRETVETTRETAKGLLVGVVSGKNFDKTTLFTRVSAYKHWIDTDSGFILRSNVFCIAITVLVL